LAEVTLDETDACYRVVILLADDSEETKEFIASVFQPSQLSSERYAEFIQLVCGSL